MRRGLLIVLLSVLCTAGLLTVPASREALLRSAGWMLVAEDPPRKADIIIVSTDSLGAGILEASKLVDAGYASRVAMFSRTPSPLQVELTRRGLPHVDIQATMLALLRALGVGSIEMLPPVTGTNDEGQLLRDWCVAEGIRSVIFVSVADHSRRTRRVLNRALGQHGIAVVVRWARYSQFDPNTWWLTREGQRVEIVESEKLLADVLRHPF